MVQAPAQLLQRGRRVADGNLNRGPLTFVGSNPEGGRVSAMLSWQVGRVKITGDMTHHPCQLAHSDWLLGDNDPKAAAFTRSRLFADWADQTILVIGTHFAAPTAGHVVRDGAAFRFVV
jgi:hypothetical protein